MLKRKRGRSLAALVAAGVLAIAVSAVPLAAQVPEKALECNSMVSITLGAEVAATGGVEVPVTLKVANGLTRDGANMSVQQEFPQVEFRGSCVSTGPCAPDPALPVTYVAGSYNPATADACPGLVGLPMVTGGNITFDFGTPGLILGESIVTPGVFPLPDTASCPGGPGAGPTPGVPLGQGCDCTIDFRVFIPNTAVAIPPNMEFPIEAAIMGNCSQVSAGAGSQDTATTQIARVPTMGQAALLALAVILLASAAAVLRRRGSADLLGG